MTNDNHFITYFVYHARTRYFFYWGEMSILNIEILN